MRPSFCKPEAQQIAVQSRPQSNDRCANPLLYFWSFHAPHHPKSPQIEYIYKNIKYIDIFQIFGVFRV